MQTMENVAALSWIDEELGCSEFPDTRLGERFRTLVSQLSGKMGGSVPLACQDWAATKAAYRFFSNNRVSEAAILSGHFQSTKNRFVATSGMALILHDTTEFTFKRQDKQAIGMTCVSYKGKRNKDGRPRFHAVCGILQHASMVVTPEGLPLGMSAVKYWTRKEFKGCNALKKHINPTRVPIEEKESFRWLENIRQATALLQAPERCVHIGDRESDIYELFHDTQSLGTHFLVRTCVDRLVGDGTQTLMQELSGMQPQGTHGVEVRDKDGTVSHVELEIKFRKVIVRPPVGPKAQRYPPTELTVIHAREKRPPSNRDRVDWKLATSLPVTSCAEAVTMLKWYALRWKIEVFHKILKSGCRTESSRLRTAERLLNLIAIFCILSWRVFWMTMLGRAISSVPTTLALTETECKLLDRLIPDGHTASPDKVSLAPYIIKIARLGGYLNRKSDPPPGNMVMWRGITKLTDIQIGYEMAQLVGN